MMLACCEEIVKENKRYLPHQTSVLQFFKSSPGNRALPPVLLDTGDDSEDDMPTVQEEVPPP
jgi:hypothetical protein